MVCRVVSSESSSTEREELALLRLEPADDRVVRVGLLTAGIYYTGLKSRTRKIEEWTILYDETIA